MTASKPRIDFTQVPPEACGALYTLERYVRHCSLDPGLLELIEVRASQINGSDCCIEMHWNDSASKLQQKKVRHVSAWHRSPLYSVREKSALAWTEAVTQLGETGVPDAAYEKVREQFTDREVIDLTIAIAMINTWNRLAVSLHGFPRQCSPVYDQPVHVPEQPCLQ